MRIELRLKFAFWSLFSKFSSYEGVLVVESRSRWATLTTITIAPIPDNKNESRYLLFSNLLPLLFIEIHVFRFVIGSLDNSVH